VTEDLLLEPDEELLWAGRPRLSAAAGSVAAGLVLVAAGVAAGLFAAAGEIGPAGLALGVVLVLVGVQVPAWRLLTLRRTRYAISDRALYARSGVLSRRVVRMGLDRVQNSAYSQSALGGLFGYGTVGVESAGGGRSVRFVRIETPREVRALVDRRAALAGDSVPGTVEQWTAVLEEVRALRTALTGERDPESGSGSGSGSGG
jgi:uncharacterized membrane protein YdbT with pleckstrin-like domain